MAKAKKSKKVVEDTIVEETVSEIVEETVAEETAEEVVAEQVVAAEEPAVEEPAVEEPAVVAEEPAVEEPAVEEPDVEEPAVVAEEPAVEEPAAVAAEEPAAEEPAVEEPAAVAAEEPAVEEPAAVAAEEPAVEEPAVEEPVVSAVEEPAVEEPVAEEPAIEEPAVAIEETVVAVEEPAIKENIVMEMQPVETVSVPKLVIIVPYRDRNEQKQRFEEQMKIVLEDMNESQYRIIYAHQCDARSFNRGAMKNIGFQWVKQTYPLDYSRITLAFQDVDTIPAKKNLFNYETTPGTIKHFYGHQFALGGIVSINAADFEKLNGFPNYWAWGFEDNSLQNRAVATRMNIDRSVFFPMMDPNIIKLDDGISRVVNRTEFDRYMNEYKYNNTNDGIRSLFDVNFQMDDATGMLNVVTFGTPISENPETNKTHDIRQSRPFFVGRRGARMGMGF